MTQDRSTADSEGSQQRCPVVLQPCAAHNRKWHNPMAPRGIGGERDNAPPAHAAVQQNSNCGETERSAARHRCEVVNDTWQRKRDDRSSIPGRAPGGPLCWELFVCYFLEQRASPFSTDTVETCPESQHWSGSTERNIMQCTVLIVTMHLLFTVNPVCLSADENELTGRWKIKKLLTGGIEAPDKKTLYRCHQIIDKGEIVQCSPSGKPGDGKIKYTLDTSKSPKWIDLHYQLGTTQCRMKGIYKRKDNLLIKVWSDPGKPRPTSFESTEANGYNLLILARDRKP